MTDSSGAPPTRRPSGFLDQFDAAQIEQLLWYLERLEVEPGDVLISEGNVDQSLFIVVRGAFEVTREGQLLAVLRSGNVLGELAFLDARPRSASVTVTESGEVLRMTRAGFDEMRGRDADLACALAIEVGRALSERFRDSQKVPYGAAQPDRGVPG